MLSFFIIIVSVSGYDSSRMALVMQTAFGKGCQFPTEESNRLGETLL